MDEKSIIKRIRWHSREGSSGKYSIGIGDDSAVRECSKGECLVITGDTMVEGVHFDLGVSELSDAGFKSVASCISDCAAMGGVPDSVLIQVVVPGRAESERGIDNLYKGIEEACRLWGIEVIGGDLSQGCDWVIAITMMGRIPEGSYVKRLSDAEPGDRLWVTGYPGKSFVGLSILQRFGRTGWDSKYKDLIRAHLRPEPSVETGVKISSCAEVHSLTDISDGIVKEAYTISEKSGVSIEIMEESIPCTKDMIEASAELSCSVTESFLNGGEDYEYMFTASKDFHPEFMGKTSKEFFCIGNVIEQGSGVSILSGESRNSRRLLNTGWDHFAEL